MTSRSAILGGRTSLGSPMMVVALSLVAFGLVVLLVLAVAPTAFEPAVRAWAALDAAQPGLPVALVLVATIVVAVTFLATAYGEPYLAALWITAARLPGLIAVAWLLAAIAPGDASVPITGKLGLGLWVALMTWIGVSIPFRRLGMPATSQGTTFGELVVRYNQLKPRIDALDTTKPGVTPVYAEASEQ